MTDETLRILKAARALITDPTHWTKGTLAAWHQCHAVSPTSADARAWCATGAVVAVSVGQEGCDEYPYDPAVMWSCCAGDRRLAILALETSIGAVGCRGYLEYFNDHHEHADVLGLFDRAIAAGEAERLMPEPELALVCV